MVWCVVKGPILAFHQLAHPGKGSHFLSHMRELIGHRQLSPGPGLNNIGKWSDLNLATPQCTTRGLSDSGHKILRALFLRMNRVISISLTTLVRKVTYLQDIHGTPYMPLMCCRMILVYGNMI